MRLRFGRAATNSTALGSAARQSHRDSSAGAVQYPADVFTFEPNVRRSDLDGTC